jgi:hypothetical protein
LTVRGAAAVEIGPVTDELACLRTALLQLEAAGYRAQIAGQHDKGWGYLIHGGRDGQAAAAVVLAWSTRYMQQGRLEIYFQREGLLPPAQHNAGPCRWRIILPPDPAHP